MFDWLDKYISEQRVNESIFRTISLPYTFAELQEMAEEGGEFDD